MEYNCEALQESNHHCDEIDSKNSSVINDYLNESSLSGERRFHSLQDNKLTHQSDFKSNFEVLQVWEGYIETIEKDEIVSRLYNAVNNSINIYEFNIHEVSEDDKPLVKPGALFFLYLGYDNIDGTVRKSLYVKFRRFLSFQDYIDEGLDAINNNKQYFDDIWE